MLWLCGLKVFLDGGMLTGSGFMREPWGTSTIYSITDPNYRGMHYINQQRLHELAKASLKRDLQFTAHSVGDGAVQALIEAYEQVNKEFPVREGPLPYPRELHDSRRHREDGQNRHRRRHATRLA